MPKIFEIYNDYFDLIMFGEKFVIIKKVFPKAKSKKIINIEDEITFDAVNQAIEYINSETYKIKEAEYCIMNS